MNWSQNSRKNRFVWQVMTGGVLLAGRLHAQAVYGSIFGTVTDNTGAAVPNATITVLDTAKGTSNSVTSNSSGEFTIGHLIPDTYQVKIAVQGFKSYQQTDLHVFADTSLKVTAALEVGSTTETVDVAADQVPLLKTDRADVSTTFDAKQIVDLPIPDRNFTNLQLLLPGAQLLGWSHAASENPQGSKQIEVDGQAFAGVAFQLDGTDNEDPILGIIVVNPNSDSLSETKITTQNFDAEFGKAVSSVVTAQTKSGTNQFHGSAFDYRESNANLARDPFTQGPSQLSATNPFPAGLKNQFGGSIGGPIFKDKAFFFGDYQGVRQKVGIANVQTVPTQHLIQSCLGAVGCDFSEYKTAIGNALNPSNAAAAAAYNLIYQPGTTIPYQNSIIPKAQLSPQALALLTQLQPYAPNTPGTVIGGSSFLRNNYAKSGTGGFNSDQWDARLDLQANQSVHAFGRFSRFTDTLTGTTMFGQAGGAGFGLGGYGGTSLGANDSAAAGVDIVVTPKWVTDIRLGYFRYGINTSKYDQSTAYATQLGIAGLNTGSNFTNGAPQFSIAEVNTFGGQNNGTAQGPQYGSGLNVNRCNCPLSEHEDQYQVVNNWTRVLGNHEIKFGADLRYARNLRVPSDTNRTGALNFGTGITGGGLSNAGLGFATFVLGDVTTFSRYVSTSTNAKEFQKRTFFYAQDTWRVTPKLTVNYGLRYELYFPEKVNGVAQGALLNLDTGYLQVAGVGGVNQAMNYNLPGNTYNPRLGIAYQVRPQTVIRAGYGRSYDIGVFGSIFGHAATQNLPVLANQSVTGTNGDNATNNQNFAFNLGTAAPAAATVTVPANGLLPNPGGSVTSRTRPNPLRLPTLDAWNASLQQSLTPTLSMTIAYVGNKGTHTFGDASGNTTNPNESGIFLPAADSVNGNALHYDPTVGSAVTTGGYLGVAANGGTSNQTLLQRYYGMKLPGCGNQACGWNQSITDYSDNLDTHYNALQVTMTQQMKHGISLNANYAWQQAISEATGYSTWSRPAVRGRDSALRQQQVIVYGLLQLPFGRNKAFLNHTNGFINQVVSGFEINPVITYSGGLPYSITSNTSAAWIPGSAPGYLNGDAKDFHHQVSGIPGNSLYWYPQTTLATNPYHFTAPTLDTIGNIGRSSFFGPHFFNTDLSIQKNFIIKEGIDFQLRADGFNAFNHINWGTPDGTLEDGGSITSGPFPGSSANPRQLQFSGRIQF